MSTPLDYEPPQRRGNNGLRAVRWFAGGWLLTTLVLIIVSLSVLDGPWSLREVATVAAMVAIFAAPISFPLSFLSYFWFSYRRAD